MKIDVCIATYRRPQWLGQLLRDLDGQQLLEPCTLRVIVVDNDAECTARPVAAEFRSDRLELIYRCQPVKNIALTRNEALEQTDADWVAFVDDDESVPPNWLRSLLECQRQFDADVVFGPVEGRLATPAPDWICRGGYFKAHALPNGAPVRWGSTNNALVRGQVIADGARFDRRYGLTGGEDTHFFFGLSQQGVRMVWCPAAMITEHVPANRMTLRWLLQRSFRGGQSFADIVARPNRLLPLMAWALRRSAMLLAGVALTCLGLPFGPMWAIRHALRVAAHAGELSTMFKFRLQEYR